MGEQRKVTVVQVHPKQQEYDREVLVELWHNAYHTTALSISVAEAVDLYAKLGQHLREAQAMGQEVPRG